MYTNANGDFARINRGLPTHSSKTHVWFPSQINLASSQFLGIDTVFYLDNTRKAPMSTTIATYGSLLPQTKFQC
jgi:hypothetical protein